MAFSKYYIYEPDSPGAVRLVFDDHVMHAENLRDHLEGFLALPEQTFDVTGAWVTASVLLYSNGIPNRMRDGLVWIISRRERNAFAEWISKAAWPTKETMSDGLSLPGRWLTEEEAARFWLHLQGVPVDISSEEVVIELKRLGTSLSRFSEHIPSESDG